MAWGGGDGGVEGGREGDGGWMGSGSGEWGWGWIMELCGLMWLLGWGGAGVEWWDDERVVVVMKVSREGLER